jgi:hypothetical protein
MPVDRRLRASTSRRRMRCALSGDHCPRFTLTPIMARDRAVRSLRSAVHLSHPALGVLARHGLLRRRGAVRRHSWHRARLAATEVVEDAHRHVDLKRGVTARDRDARVDEPDERWPPESVAGAEEVTDRNADQSRPERGRDAVPRAEGIAHAALHAEHVRHGHAQHRIRPGRRLKEVGRVAGRYGQTETAGGLH